MGKSKKDKTSEEINDLEHLIYRAMLRRGWVIPQDMSDVIEQDPLSDYTGHVPESLLNPYSILNRSKQPTRSAPTLPLVDEQSAESEVMARAARTGRKITSAVEERMRRDRQTAEREEQLDDD